jgi:hypothetical protein
MAQQQLPKNYPVIFPQQRRFYENFALKNVERPVSEQ